MGAEGSRPVGRHSENVTIRYNRILCCRTGVCTIDAACGIDVNVGAESADVSRLDKHILIEGNIIKGENAENGISVSGAKDIVIRCNEIVGCRKPVHAVHSTNVTVSSNAGINDLKYR